MTKYRVGALVSSMIYDEFEAEDEEQAMEKMQDKWGDRSIDLCFKCSEQVSGLTVSEDMDTYEVEEIGYSI